MFVLMNENLDVDKKFPFYSYRIQNSNVSLSQDIRDKVGPQKIKNIDYYNLKTDTIE